MYPLTQQFMASEPFGPDHAAHDLQLTDPIAPALEYFLSLKNVKGYSEKIEEIRALHAHRHIAISSLL